MRKLEYIIKRNANIFNVRNFIIINAISLFICSFAESLLVIDNKVYKLNFFDIIFRTITSPRRMVLLLPMFYIIILFLNFFVNDNKSINMIRYSSKRLYYIKRIKTFIKFILFFDFIFLVNILASAFIKGQPSMEWSQAINIIYSNTDKYNEYVVMNAELIRYNPLTQFILYMLIISLYFMLLAIFMEIMDNITNSKIMSFIASMAMFFVIAYNTFNSYTSNIVGLLVYNHLDINMQGFNLFQNNNANYAISILHLLLLDILLYFIGRRTANNKEIYT